MTLSVTDTDITSDVTRHHARRLKPVLNNWEVSWFWNSTGLTKDQAIAAMELAEIVAKGRDGGPDTTNYAYDTWRRVMELADVLGVRPLKTVLLLEGLNRNAGGIEPDPKK